MVVSDICSRDVKTIDRDATIEAAAEQMREQHVGSLVVVEFVDERPRPIGILTDRDIVVEIVAAGLAQSEILVGDAMTYELVTMPGSTGLYEAVELMRQRGVRRVPVVDTKGYLIGLMSSDDALEVISNQLTDLTMLVGWQQRKESYQRQ